ncbi:MAG TPA: chitin-binding domain-containing protein [Solirubrobacterales bacterium]|nr:chitin-binding domain-containing protein [Solirubrobacterales bacterium]
MNPIRKRLTYANVMSSIAVFLLVGGGAAFAATQLPKNSVGTKQIKKNAVTTPKIKNGAVTGAKLKLSTLGKVPSAASADHATNADQAANANTVGGNAVQRIFYRSGETSPTQTILSLDGLTLTATCTADELSANATTSVANSIIHSSGVSGFPTAFYEENDTFSPGENLDFLANAETASDSVEGTLTYMQPGGTVVSVVYLAEEDGFGTGGCEVSGYAIG